ncbi:MAG: FprA family A-type flavoprotein [Candidatus Bathyarchaeota archaeon]|nr:MAG: FprA family A-type flavoprotein [Candidatus Bathyarchaeota archaeon]
MVKVFVVYDTKYGNTKLVAENIIEGMREVGGIETAISDIEEVDIERLADYDAILIGSPNHMGGPVRGVMKLIDKLGKLDLKARWAAVFDTYLGGDFGKAVKKMEKRISEKTPRLKLIVPSLSIKVGGMKGPIADGELPKCKEFGKKIADKLKT